MTPLVFGLPQGSEIVILLIVAILIFGGSKLAGLGKGAGRAIREFKEETNSLRSESSRPHDEVHDAEIVDEHVDDTRRVDPHTDNR